MDPRNDAVFPDEDLEDDEESLDDEDDDEEEEELNDDPSPSTSSAGAVPVPSVSATVTVATPAVSVVPPPSIVSISSADLIRQRLETATAEPLTLQGEKKPLDESRKLFQRLWTDEDEIELLQGFLDYTMQRGTTHHHQNDTALFYDQIKSKLQLDFNKNQLVEKLRRLKKKYRNVIGKISSGKDFNFKSPHDQATFEISRKIWSNTGRIGVDDNALDDDEPAAPTPYASYMDHRNEEMMANCAEKKPTPTPKSRKRTRPGSGIRMDVPRSSNENLSKEKNSTYHNNTNNNENVNNVAVAGLIEETVRSCLSPLFKELLNTSMGGGLCGGSRGFSGLALHPIPLSFGGASINFGGGGEMADERWRKQQILELEVYSKRLELVQEQIKTALEDLRSMGG